MDAENPVNRERISLLKVPLDIVPPEQLGSVIFDLLNEVETSGEGRNIVLLSLWDLLRARRNGEYRTYVQNAALVIPISKSLVGGARFLTGKKAIRYMPFDFVVQLLTILENREFSAFLLGAKARILKKTEKNIRLTFPRLRIVGRCIGAFKRQIEASILEAIRKASPHLLLVGKGARGKELWIARNSSRLSRGLRLWCSDLFDVFAERKQRPSRYAFEKGLEWIGFLVKNPLRFFRIFSFMYYNLLLLLYKIFKKG
ncbi:UDP-N-acetyl-D-mannosamine transferase [Spirochaetia bacterium]|nr:UDP-N-acetyl-D-mannosamine transferase [Spirochaetia bacterium]